MTEAAATPAAAEPATPAAAPTIDSLIPAEGTAPAAAAEPAKDPAKPAAAPATPAAEETPKWFYSDGVPGKGEPPAWYKADKYKTLDAQAQAYTDLEKRFGQFVGAPKDGKYEVKLPETVKGEFDTENPLFLKFTDWAKGAQLSQEGYNQVLGMLAEYEAANAVDMGEVKKAIGEKADERIGAVAQWAKANLPADTFNDLRNSMTGANADKVFKVIETLVNKTRQPSISPTATDVAQAQPVGEAALRAKMGEKDENGRLKYFHDAKFRSEIDTQMRNVVGAQ
jgi:hypothetical protein